MNLNSNIIKQSYEPSQINARIAEKSKSTLMESTNTRSKNSLVTQNWFPRSNKISSISYKKSSIVGNIQEKSLSNSVNSSRYNETMPYKQLDDYRVNKNSISSIYNEHCRTVSDKNWSMLLSVVKIVKKFNNVEVKCISNSNDIDREIQVFREKKESLAVAPSHLHNNFVSNNTDSLREELRKLGLLHLIYEQIKEGKESSIENIKSFFLRDTKRNIFSEKNHFLINQPNTEGVTPLGIACTNGHLSIVKALVSVDANHLIKCNAESLLETSLRWNHLAIFEFLIGLEWPKDYIYDCKRLASSISNNPRINLLITSKLKQLKKANSCCFS